MFPWRQQVAESPGGPASPVVAPASLDPEALAAAALLRVGFVAIESAQLAGLEGEHSDSLVHPAESDSRVVAVQRTQRQVIPHRGST